MKIVAKRQWRYPLSLERSYAKYLVAHVQRNMAVIKSFLPEMKKLILQYRVKLDADDDSTMVNAYIDILIDELRKATESSESMRTIVRKMADQVDRYNETEFNTIIKSVFGANIVSVGGSLVKMDAAVDDMAQLKDMWVQQNIDLISSIDDETLQKIRDRMAERIINNVDSNLLTKYLIQDLQDIAGIETRRATLIGTDQVGKLNGSLSQYRQQHAGISEYKWHTCMDSRVRDIHSAREGIIYKWSNPPPDGNPGRPIRCRCVALPVIDLDTIPIVPRKGSFVAAKATTKAKATGIINLDEAKTFDQLIQYFADSRGITVDTSVTSLDFYSVKTSCMGIDNVISEFPKAAGSFKNIGTRNSGIMSASYGGKIAFNPKYYKDYKNLEGEIQGDVTGFHAKNTGIMEFGSHEGGHILEKALIDKSGMPIGVLAWNDCTCAKDVIKEAWPLAKKTAAGKGKKVAQLKAEISGYATSNDSECLAEAVADYMANGDDASALSIEIWKILKRELG